MMRRGRLLAGAILLIWMPYVSAQAERKVELRDPGASGQAERPAVLRGAAIAPKPVAAEPAGGRGLELRAGERLWLIDPDDRRVVACERRYGARVGSSFIRCTDGALPVGLQR